MSERGACSLSRRPNENATRENLPGHDVKVIFQLKKTVVRRNLIPPNGVRRQGKIVAMAATPLKLTAHDKRRPSGRIWHDTMRRYLPYFLVSAVLTAAILMSVRLYREHQSRRTVLRQLPVVGKPGAEPPHVRGVATAPVSLEEFGDFECMPCLLLWPALRNLENDYGERLAVIFRQHPLAQHQHAAQAARASEAAGLQDRFWEMHDLLYLKRSTWTGASDPSAAFQNLAAELGLDVDRFGKDIDSPGVAQRIKADEDRGESLGIDRTPIVFINGKRVDLLPDVENGLRTEIDAALKNPRSSAN